MITTDPAIEDARSALDKGTPHRFVVRDLLDRATDLFTINIELRRRIATADRILAGVDAGRQIATARDALAGGVRINGV